jgi:inorganic pyrophosphatase
MKPLHVVIETPKGSTEKYSYHKKTGLFKLNKILPSGLVFPFDFGFLPGTEGDDGDPLDALVICEFKSFTGCLMECRLIGAVLVEEMEKEKTIRNDRYFFIPVLSKQFKDIEKLEDLPAQFRDETEKFFVEYKKAEGSECKIIGTIGPEKAYKMVRKNE